jgi:integrase
MSVKKISDNKFEYLAWAPKPGGGRRQVRKRGFPTAAKARDAEAELRADIARDAYVIAHNVRLSDYLNNTWLVARAASVKPSTLASYQLQVATYVVPAIGDVRLKDLDGPILSRFYATLVAAGRTRRDGGLAPKTVRNIAGLLNKALADAVRWKVISANPAPDAERPRAVDVEMRTWSAEQLAAFLRFVADDRFAAMWRLAAMTGMRRAEICGLRWRDVDLDAGRLAICQTRTVVKTQVLEGSPKTRAGARLIALDEGTVAALRSWWATQAADRLAVGPGWIDTELVFTKPEGIGVPPQWVSREFGRLSRLAGLPPIRLHDFRHTYITVALSVARVPVKVVSQRVGHANVGVTLGLYAHVLPGDDEAAAEAVARSVEQSW